MSGQHGAGVQSGTAQAWSSVRRVREPIAWALLAVAAVMVLVGAGQLFNVPSDIGSPVCGPTGTSCFALRALAVQSAFVSWIVIAPPVLSVVLVAFSGGLTRHARHVLTTAAVVQAGTLVLGVLTLAGAISLVGAPNADVPASTYVFDAATLAVVASALIFTAAVVASRAVRSLR